MLPSSLKWKHFARYWPFVRRIHRSPVNSPQKGQWSGALISSLIDGWINGWVNNREAGDLRCHRANYNITVMVGFDLGVLCKVKSPQLGPNYSGVTRASCRPKSLAARLFDQQCFTDNKKTTFTGRCYSSFVGKTTTNGFHGGPVMRKTLLGH